MEVGGVPILSSTSLHVRAGEVVAVTGPSGSGKTTLLNCVAGIIVPSSGVVLINGIEMSSLRPAARAKFRRNHIGLVFQDPELLDELSVVENVSITMIFNGADRTDATDRADAMLRTLDVGHLSASRTATLSGGEAQRVAVARALVKDASVIVADEPTASLDAVNVVQVTRLLVDAARRSHAALMIATHDPTVASLCDHVVSLREGGQSAA